MATVFIPPLLRSLCDGNETVSIEATSLRGVIAALEDRHPGIRAKLCDADGNPRPDLAFAVDGHVTSRGLLQKVAADSEIHILPAIGGG